MAIRKFLLEDPAKPEGPDNEASRKRIEDALLELMAEGERLNHDLVAKRAGLSRRTVYRYHPDRDALLRALWSRLSPGAAGDKLPRSLTTMLDRQPALFDGFDKNATAMTVTMASAEGRKMRNAITAERTAAYREALAEETAHLPEPSRTHAIAAIQLLNSGLAWREMRDQWSMDGQSIAATCRWAIETLLKDLEQGGGPPA
ncbi:helix-turn-helix domain-containing protein [Sphingomonas sp. G-3-2-10]|uniref:TetR/AcrR family transcriptional regulator n=1 Tax=Sphingomonas sp. G-3-2-10 TaxID=2728838 RepID=UPI00146B941A|nr:helix-turn-helix domain-containing protein [Sphingomonas sp. G-3-2-10]NML06017.1 helix-turn-helix transcriptional regulator [Sphingomonas sp. G-3-2-10]